MRIYFGGSETKKVTSSKLKNWAALAVIAVLGFSVYFNSLPGDFVWDDHHFIVNNVYLRDWAHLPRIFTRDVGSASGEIYNYYRPLAIFTYLLDYTAWKLNPIGYHLSSVVYHLLVAASVFWLIRILFSDRLLAFLTGLLFALHPIQTETVAYLSGRPDSLVALFILLTFILYLKQLDRKSLPLFLLMVLAYLLAVLSRENCIVLPPLLLLYHLAFRRKVRLYLILPPALLALLYVLGRFLFIDPAVVPTSLSERLPGTFTALFEYFRLLLLPLHLHQEYGTELFSFSDPRAIAGLGIATALLVGGLLSFLRAGSGAGGGRRPCRLIFFGIFWFLIALLPVSGIYPIKTYLAEHWLYLPSIGLFLLAATLLASLYRSDRGRSLIITCLVGLVVFYGGLTVKQNRYFNNPLDFYERTLKYCPGSARLHNNLGIKYYEAGRVEEGMARFRKALELEPNYPAACNNLGYAYYRLGRHEEAEAIYKRAIEINPAYADAWTNLGVLSCEEGDFREGIRSFRKASELNPYDPAALFNLAVAYKRIGEVGEAEGLLKRILEIDPFYGRAHLSLARLYSENGQPERASAHARRASELGYEVEGKLFKK